MSTESRLEFAAALAYETYVYPSSVASLAKGLMLLARAIHRYNEGACNGEEWATEKRGERLQAKVRALLAPYKIGAVFQGDPRGAAVKLVFPHTKRTNDWGQEGYCVPS